MREATSSCWRDANPSMTRGTGQNGLAFQNGFTTAKIDGTLVHSERPWDQSVAPSTLGKPLPAQRLKLPGGSDAAFTGLQQTINYHQDLTTAPCLTAQALKAPAAR